jgi:3-hydroxyacyl-[acyl-carrier-protein] dehydratase
VPQHEHRFDARHPTAAGHFPGNPIIPGAALLDEVLEAIAAVRGNLATPCEIASVKFLLPVRPGDRIVIRWQEAPSGVTRFDCVFPDSERIILKGSMNFSSPAR